MASTNYLIKFITFDRICNAKKVQQSIYLFISRSVCQTNHWGVMGVRSGAFDILFFNTKVGNIQIYTSNNYFLDVNTTFDLQIQGPNFAMQI